MKVIEGGEQIFTLIAFPNQNQSNKLAIDAHLAQVAQQAAQIGAQHAMVMINQAQQSWENFKATILEGSLIQSAIETINGATCNNPHLVYCYTDLQQMQLATPLMQVYMMANPVVSEMYLNNQICGFPETYNGFVTGVGIDNEIYRQVTDGMVQFEDDEDGECFVYEFGQTHQLTSRALNEFEQISIMNTWENMNTWIKAGFDPTNPDGGRL